jgi:hypothetical protein
MGIAQAPGTAGPQSGNDPGKPEITAAAQGKELDGEGERAALDYLLGTPTPAKYKVVVQYETPAGMKELEFHFRAMDGRKIDKIEQQNISQLTGVMDKLTADAQLVSEATDVIVDPETGMKIGPREERFRTIKEGEAPLASGIDAIQARFGTQIGLIAGVASAIREAAGWNRERVGKASRLLVDAAGN